MRNLFISACGCCRLSACFLIHALVITVIVGWGCGGSKTAAPVVMEKPPAEVADDAAVTLTDTLEQDTTGQQDGQDDAAALSSKPAPKPKARPAAGRKQTGVSADDTVSSGTAAPPPAAPRFETVEIGGKIWMKKNLSVAAAGSWCYDNSPASCKQYGRLYSWSAAVKVCADLGDGWRLPDDDDWNALLDAAGGKDVAGTKLKSAYGWKPDANGKITDGKDNFGFTALPGGYRYSNGDYISIGDYGYWWSASAGSGDYARSRNMGSANEYVTKSNNGKNIGFSVRCVKDAQ